MIELVRVALSIKQPWAWLIVNRYKDIENRDWPTQFRGYFAVHAGKSFDHEGYKFVRDEYPAVPLPEPHEFELGGIVGGARVVDCVEEHESDWFYGLYGFVLDQRIPMHFIPMRGQLGFFKLPFVIPVRAMLELTA